MGRLIAIEGLDASGKGTQTRLLTAALTEQGQQVVHVSFPDYESPSSSLVKMYLNGDFGNSARDVNAYAASSFYAVDRYASYKTGWERDYLADKLIIADRYATSNLIYQLGKLPKADWAAYVSWIDDFEYVKMGIPRPDAVIYLDMPVAVSQGLLLKRYGGDATQKDIHELNVKFLNQCAETAAFAADKLGWYVIGCADGLQPRPVEAIQKDILKIVKKLL